jgi:hypothetical protein
MEVPDAADIATAAHTAQSMDAAPQELTADVDSIAPGGSRDAVAAASAKAAAAAAGSAACRPLHFLVQMPSYMKLSVNVEPMLKALGIAKLSECVKRR